MNEQWMRRAIDLAERGRGRVSPNPVVGAVIVKDDQVIGEGWHEVIGQAHAERQALRSCRVDPRGASMYVTLEPCNHTGRQPPCTDAIIDSGISRVVVGSLDPNPKVTGQGIKRLRAAGIEVITGVLEQETDRQNEIFRHFIQHQTPFVALKYAMSLDGKIAAHTGQSKWITSDVARQHVHGLRNRYQAILIGRGTALSDDPLLTCRIPGGRQPLRIICDSELKTPLKSQLVQTSSVVPTVFVTARPLPRARLYEAAGARVWVIGDESGQVDLARLIQRLGDEGIDSVLVEGGAAIHGAFLEAGLAQKVYAYIAPILLGGVSAPSPIAGLGFDSPAEACHLSPPRITALGPDILLESEVQSCLPESSKKSAQ